MTDDRTIDELVADAENAPVGSRCATLDAIRQDASGGGVIVTVDLYGKLVGLELSRTALEAGAADVAGRIRELVAEATLGATRQGMAVLAGIAGLAETPLADELARLLPDEPKAEEEPQQEPARVRRAPAREPEPEDDPVPVTLTAW